MGCEILNVNLSISVSATLIDHKTKYHRNNSTIRLGHSPVPYSLSQNYGAAKNVPIGKFGSTSTSTSTSTSMKRRRCECSLSLDFPLLPLPLAEVLVPSERKTIHLYEARYLALLEESLFKKDKLFVHFVLEPIVIDDLSSEPSFAARHACLVLIENVEQLDVGALVSIRGITRVQIVKFLQSDPYLKGEVVPFHDNSPDSVTNLSSKVSEVKEVLSSLNSLEIKLKAPRDEKLQTNAANSLMWAEQELSINCDDTFVPSLAERISFASLQPISGSTQSELQALQRERLNAMDSRDTLLRLDMSLEFAKKNISIIAAKLAIQSLEIE